MSKKNTKKIKNAVNTNNIEAIVLKYFIRVIKDDGKYLLFRHGVNNTGIMKYIISKQSNPYRPYSDVCPFIKCSSNAEVAETLKNISNNMTISQHKNLSTIDKYEHVTMTINHLLHFFMEANGVTMEHLCELGEEIYSLSCNKLFGDVIEEPIKQEPLKEEKMTPIRTAEELKAKLFQEFLDAVKDGSNVTFAEYLSKHKKVFDKFTESKQEDNDFSSGHILGRAPNDVNPFLEAATMPLDLPSWGN